MTRTIKASEIRPEMEVQWTHAGITRQCTPSYVDTVSPRNGAHLRTFEGGSVHIPDGIEVTVLSEPQPEEPTEFGAKVRVRDGRFVRLDWEDSSSRPWHEKGTGYRWSWDDLCEIGPVTVVPDQGWTVPAEAPEVPERIEEWPENDEALREYEWLDSNGRPWMYSWTYGRWYNFSRTAISKMVTYEPKSGPWTRVSDA